MESPPPAPMLLESHADKCSQIAPVRLYMPVALDHQGTRAAHMSHSEGSPSDRNNPNTTSRTTPGADDASRQDGQVELLLVSGHVAHKSDPSLDSCRESAPVATFCTIRHNSGPSLPHDVPQTLKSGGRVVAISLCLILISLHLDSARCTTTKHSAQTDPWPASVKLEGIRSNETRVATTTEGNNGGHLPFAALQWDSAQDHLEGGPNTKTLTSTNTSTSANATTSIQKYLERKSFGQRLQFTSDGSPSSSNDSLLARTLRHLGSKSSYLINQLSSESTTNSSASSLKPKLSTENVLDQERAGAQGTKRDYEITQINGVGSKFTGEADATSLAPSRPNLSLDTWAKLMNLRKVANVSQVFKLSSSNSRAPGSGLTPGALRRALAPYKPSISLTNSSSSPGQESLLIGILTRPDGQSSSFQSKASSLNGSANGNRTKAPPRVDLFTSKQNHTFHLNEPALTLGSPDWQASEQDIAQVIYVGKSKHQETGANRSSNKTRWAHDEHRRDNELDRESLKGHELRDDWKKQTGGEQQQQKQSASDSKAADKRLVDVGHNKHGWKNVYHKEEYAQHQKYHDVFHDKDWHDQRAVGGESKHSLDGSKFNKSQSSEYVDKDKHATSKYDYRKGNEWKRSEETADEAADEHQKEAHSSLRQNSLLHNGENGAFGQHQRRHHQVAAATDSLLGPQELDQNNDQDAQDQDDDLVLEQMRSRLEAMSEQHNGDNDGAATKSKTASLLRKPAASIAYELKRPPSPSAASRQDWSVFGANQTLNSDKPANRSWSFEHQDQAVKDDSLDEGDNEPEYHQHTDQDQMRPEEEVEEEEEHEQDRRKRTQNRSGGQLKLVNLEKPIQVAATQDKRNQLRLKLELDLGKSTSAISAPPTNQGDGQPATQAKRSNYSSAKSLTNSLGENIGRGSGSSSKGGRGWGQSTPSGGRFGLGLEPPQPESKWQSRDPADKQHPGWLQFDQDNNKTSRQQRVTLTGHYGLQVNGALAPQTKSTSKNDNKKPAFSPDGIRAPTTFMGSGSGSSGKPSGGKNHTAADFAAGLLPAHVSRPIFVKHLEMNGGLVLGKLEDLPSHRSNRSTLSPMSFANYEDHPILSSEDLTVETMPMMAGSGEQLHPDHELTLSGARPTISMLDHQQQERPKDYMLVFGGSESDEHERHMAAGSHHYHQHSEPKLPPGGISGNSLSEPNVIFEAAASTLNDDLRPSSVDYFSDAARTSQPPPHYDNSPNRLLNDYLSSDYSMAQMNYMAEDGPMEQQPPLQPQVESNLYVVEHQHRQQQQEDQEKRHTPPALAMSQQQSVQNALYVQQPQQQQLRQLTQTMARPMMASLRDHMHLLPMNLLRAASSINYATTLLNHSPYNAQVSPSGSQQAVQQAAGSNAMLPQHHPGPSQPMWANAAPSAPLGRWLRLPRVLENQIQQQRSKRYKQLAEQVVAAASSATSSSSGGHGQRLMGPALWAPVVLAPNTNAQNAQLLIDPMQADYTNLKVLHEHKDEPLRLSIDDHQNQPRNTSSKMQPGNPSSVKADPHKSQELAPEALKSRNKALLAPKTTTRRQRGQQMRQINDLKTNPMLASLQVMSNHLEDQLLEPLESRIRIVNVSSSALLVAENNVHKTPLPTTAITPTKIHHHQQQQQRQERRPRHRHNNEVSRQNSNHNQRQRHRVIISRANQLAPPLSLNDYHHRPAQQQQRVAAGWQLDARRQLPQAQAKHMDRHPLSVQQLMGKSQETTTTNRPNHNQNKPNKHRDQGDKTLRVRVNAANQHAARRPVGETAREVKPVMQAPTNVVSPNGVKSTITNFGQRVLDNLKFSKLVANG